MSKVLNDLKCKGAAVKPPCVLLNPWFYVHRAHLCVADYPKPMTKIRIYLRTAKKNNDYFHKRPLFGLIPNYNKSYL